MMSWVMLMTDNVLAHISCPVVCASRQQPSVSGITQAGARSVHVTRNRTGTGPHRGLLVAAFGYEVVRIPGLNGHVALPDSWVTVYSGDIGDTFRHLRRVRRCRGRSVGGWTSVCGLWPVGWTGRRWRGCA